MGSSDDIGRYIGRYKLVEIIGRGGMATVYKAIDTALHREVALKLLHPHLAAHEESRARFEREARAVARLKHPSVVEIHDYSASQTENDDVYIVMEFVEGTTLRRFLDLYQSEPISTEAAFLIVRQVGEALSHAHSNGIIHRDVKPENILIGQDGSIKLSDFGIAHVAGVSQMTMTGQILGSPAYMSPEHIEHAELDERADIFSVGILLYELIVGQTPFAGKNPHAIIKKIVDGTYENPLRICPVAGYYASTIIQKCLNKNPLKRYADAKLLVEDLDDALTKMGIDPESDELARFFDNPSLWIDKQKPLIIDRTLAVGIAARRDRRLLEAMDHFNRVLALEPGNSRALGAVAGMNRRRVVIRAVERMAFIIPMLIAVGAIAWGLIKEKPEPRAQTAQRLPEQSETPEPDAAVSVVASEPTTTEAAPDNSSKKTVQKKKIGHRVRRVTPSRVKKTPETRVVVFTPHPLAVQIVIDGNERFSYGPENRERVIETGTHKIEFIPGDPKRFEQRVWKVDIPEGDTPFHFRGRLEWKPARLLVESNVNGVVTVPGRAVDRTNRPFEVAIQNGPEEDLSVLVSADGYLPQTKKVKIGAGELAKIKVDLAESDGNTTSP